MNKKIKKMWVSALRSGKYKQGKRLMCHGGPQGVRYCCLGVLSDLAVKHGGISRRAAFLGDSTLNQCVIEWAGLTTDNPSIISQKTQQELSVLNDDFGLSFSETASVINKNL